MANVYVSNKIYSLVEPYKADLPIFHLYKEGDSLYHSYLIVDVDEAHNYQHLKKESLFVVQDELSTDPYVNTFNHNYLKTDAYGVAHLVEMLACSPYYKLQHRQLYLLYLPNIKNKVDYTWINQWNDFNHRFLSILVDAISCTCGLALSVMLLTLQIYASELLSQPAILTQVFFFGLGLATTIGFCLLVYKEWLRYKTISHTNLDDHFLYGVSKVNFYSLADNIVHVDVL